MAFDTKYDKCQFCGADRVQNPKTGKIFCSDKCWLKKAPQQQKNTTGYVAPAPPPFAPPAPKSEATELLTEIRDLLKSIDNKTLLRDPSTGEIIPF